MVNKKYPCYGKFLDKNLFVYFIKPKTGIVIIQDKEMRTPLSNKYKPGHYREDWIDEFFVEIIDEQKIKELDKKRLFLKI